MLLKMFTNLTIKVQNEIWIGPWWNLSSNRGVDIMDQIRSHHRGVVHIFYKNDVRSKLKVFVYCLGNTIYQHFKIKLNTWKHNPKNIYETNKAFDNIIKVFFFIYKLS